MKLDVNTLICNLQGVPLKIGPEFDREGKKIVPPPDDITLADILINASLTPAEGKVYKPAEHVQRYQLALNAENARKTKSPIIEVTAETAALIKDDISRIYAPLIAGQVLPMLDGK